MSPPAADGTGSWRLLTGRAPLHQSHSSGEVLESFKRSSRVGRCWKGARSSPGHIEADGRCLGQWQEHARPWKERANGRAASEARRDTAVSGIQATHPVLGGSRPVPIASASKLDTLLCTAPTLSTGFADAFASRCLVLAALPAFACAITSLRLHNGPQPT
jgi:hypothetical protein